MTLDWQLPSPPNGVAFTPSTDTNAQAAQFFGEDVWFDVSESIANTIVTAAGDYREVTGIEALKQSLRRRTITNPGEWKTRPTFGVGARRYVKARDTAAMRSELAARIREQYLADQRVESVDEVTMERIDDAPGLRISVRFTPRGRLRTDAATSVTVEVR